MSFKFDLPTDNAGTFSFWGLGADDINNKTEDADSSNWQTDISRMNMTYKNRFGAIGLSHRISLGTKTFIHSTLSADGMTYTLDKKELTLDFKLLPTDYVESAEGKYSFRTIVNHKFNSRITSRSGITVNRLFFNNKLKKAFREKPDELLTFVDNRGNGLSF